MHWADVTAQALAHKGSKHIISTGITPSGEFHIGHLREILTGDMISRAAKLAGLDVDFIFIVDEAESELGILDLLQVFVQVLDTCFENVCELDLIYHFQFEDWIDFQVQKNYHFPFLKYEILKVKHFEV